MPGRRATPGCGLLLQQAIATRRCVEGPLLGENPWPMLRQDVQKFVDDAPMLGEPLRDQVRHPRETSLFGRLLIEKPGKARRERSGLSGRERFRATAFAPVQDEPR